MTMAVAVLPINFIGCRSVKACFQEITVSRTDKIASENQRRRKKSKRGTAFKSSQVFRFSPAQKQPQPPQSSTNHFYPLLQFVSCWRS